MSLRSVLRRGDRTGSDSNRTERGEDAGASRRPTTIRAAIRGFGGGLVATVVMSVYRLPIFRGLPPTAEFWATFIGRGEAAKFPLWGLLLHFLYGGVGGAVFGVALGRIDFDTERDRRIGGTLLALGYGVLLSAFGSRVLFVRVLKEDMDPDEAFVFHVGHAVYGLTLGTWLSSRERLGEVYD